MPGADWLQEAVRAAAGSVATAVAWRHRGRLHLTVVVKSTFTFATDGPMTRAATPRPILWAEAHHRGSPAASVRLPSDVAPRVPRAQVILAGHACSASGPTSSLTVRLGIFSGTRAVLHKELLVKEAAPFTRIPIVYERTFGGLGCDDNPLGIGAGGEPGTPTLFHPSDPARPAGLGVVGASWPARRRRLGSTKRSALDAPIAELPEGFDWSYFQSVPPDQELERLRGDEWLVLDGLSSTAARLRTCLPRARAEARFFGLASAGLDDGWSLPLEADTLILDTDAQECSVVWRSDLALPSEEALSAVAVTAGVETFDTPIAWPAAPAGRARSMPVADSAPLTRDTEKTAVLASEATVAFAPADSETAPGPSAPARPRPAAGAAPAAATSTIAAVLPLPGAASLPFLDAMGPSPLARPSGPPSERQVGTGTLAASLADLYPSSSPNSPFPASAPDKPSPASTPNNPSSSPAPGASSGAPTFMRTSTPSAEPAPPPEPASGPPPPPPASLAPIPGVRAKPAAAPDPASASAPAAAPTAAAASPPPAEAAAPPKAPRPPKVIARQKPRPPRATVPRPPASVKTGLHGGFGSDGA